MVFLELKLSHSISSSEIKEDFKEFLSKRKRVVQISPSIKMILNENKIIGVTKNSNLNREEVENFKMRSLVLLKEFKRCIKGKYSNKVVRCLCFTTNLYSPIKENDIFCIKGKTAIAIYPVIKKLPFRTKSYVDYDRKQKILIESSDGLDQVVNVLKDFIFYNVKKTAGIDVSQDIKEV